MLAKQSDRTVSGFRKTLTNLKRLKELEGKAKTDPQAAAELLLAQMQLGSVSFADAQQRAAALEIVPTELKPQLDQALLDLEFANLMTTSRDKEAYAAANEKLVTLFRAGKRPTGDVARSLCTRLMQHAMQTKDTGLYEEALTSLEKSIGDDKRFTKTIEMFRKQLETLKAGDKK